MFLLFALLQFPDGLFIRPHPAFWRVVMGAAVIYLVLLVFFVFQVGSVGVANDYSVFQYKQKSLIIHALF